VASVVIAALAVLTGAASANVQVCTSPQCKGPRGLATDFETSLLYVADHENNRIDIFKNGGTEPGAPASFGGVTEPEWIAVDNVASSPSHHDIYATTADFNVKKFEPNGTIVGEFGEHGGDGTPENCQIEHANDPIAVGPNGDVYLADSYPTGVDAKFASRVVKFSAAGACIGAVPLLEGQTQAINGLAVDSTGVIYVTNGVLLQFTGSGALVREFQGIQGTKTLGLDSEDHLFADQGGERVTVLETDHFFTEYAPSAAGGAIMRRFGYATGRFMGSPGLAALHTPNVGDLFASDPPTEVRYLQLPSQGPAFFPEACKVKGGRPGSVRATLQAEVDPEGKATEFKFEVEPVGGGAPVSSTLVQLKKKNGEVASDFELYEAAQTINGLEAETEYRCRIVATNADGQTKGPEGTFTTNEPFTFGPAWSSQVKETSAVVNAEGNPNGSAWTGQIEYVADAQYQASKFEHALRAPTPPLEYGSEVEAIETMVLGSTTLTDLAPGTLYHYRLRATQPGFSAGLVCPDEDVRQGECPELEHTFHTNGGEVKPDDRGYELVSPPEKNSAEVVGSTPQGRGFIDESAVLIQAGAASGNAVTYTSWISFGNAQAAPATSQYLSQRTPSGWTTANASPFGFQSSLFVPPYLGFTPELSFGAVKAGETPLAEGCPAEVEDFYFYEAASGAYRCLTPEAPVSPPGKFGYFFNYGGASEDGSRVFFKTRARYAGAKAGNGMNLYEWHDGQVHAVNVLPPGSGEPAPPSPRTNFGAKTGEELQSGQSVLHNAISADGSHAIWTYVPAPDAEYEASQLLDRINGTETVQIDAIQSGGTPGQIPGGGIFSAASKNGQLVYFTTPHRLMIGVKAERGHEDLYRYDFSQAPGSRLTDLTKGSVAGDVQGVIGAAEDGSEVYFVATAALTPESEANAAGQHAEAGKDNLYVNDMGDGKNHFIARLSDEDGLDWTALPKNLTARVSTDGRHLAFLSSTAQLMPAGFESTLPKSASKFAAAQKCRISETGAAFGSTACPQAFLYDRGTSSLTCASCNPAGSRPIGPALLPGWSNMSEGPRYLTADGNRLFFETYDRLLPGDENTLRDVYEFERSGMGTCSASSPSFDSVANGCHFLLSNGRSSDESFLIDASTTGRDVFFSTRSALNGWDTNENYDVYDYREGGGFPEPVAAASCEGEAGCKPPASAVPLPPAPATPSFNGPGNPKPKKHHGKKAKHHQKGKGKHKKKHKGAKKGRAGQ